MSWVAENKFLTGFGAVMLAGMGTLGYLTYSAMDKSDTATGAFDSANAQLKRLQQATPSLTDAHLKELLAQKQELTEKIGAFQAELKARVLPLEPISKEAFQIKLKNAVADINTKAAAANVERPKDFYMGFGKYQSQQPDEKAAPALARQLEALGHVMNILIKTGAIQLEEFERHTLPEEGGAKSDSGSDRKQRNAADSGDHGIIERHGLRLKFTSSDEALRRILTELANHKQQLFIIRNMSVLNQQTVSPMRLAAAPVFAPDPAAVAPAPPVAVTPAAPPVPVAPTAPGTPAAPGPEPAAPGATDTALSFVFGKEKITSIIELEVLNIGEPKSKADKSDKTGKKKDK